jgi:hypothetical protein
MVLGDFVKTVLGVTKQKYEGLRSDEVSGRP